MKPLASITALVSEPDCLTTIQTSSEPSELRDAVTEIHQARARGQHLVVAPLLDDQLGARGGRPEVAASAHLKVCTLPTVRALPRLLDEVPGIDLAVVSGPKSFEQAFFEFVYLDEVLAFGASLVLLELPEPTRLALTEYVETARAYDLRLDDPQLVILRKRGDATPAHLPFPLGWGHREPPADLADFPTPPEWGGEGMADAGGRQLYAARAWAARSAALSRHLQNQLWKAEQAAANELDAVRRQLRDRDAAAAAAVEQLEVLQGQLVEIRAARDMAERRLAQVTASRSWRLTAALRLLKRRSQRTVGR